MEFVEVVVVFDVKLIHQFLVQWCRFWRSRESFGWSEFYWQKWWQWSEWRNSYTKLLRSAQRQRFETICLKVRKEWDSKRNYWLRSTWLQTQNSGGSPPPRPMRSALLVSTESLLWETRPIWSPMLLMSYKSSSFLSRETVFNIILQIITNYSFMLY